MSHSVAKRERRFVNNFWPVAVGEGLTAGVVGNILQEYLAFPLVALLIAVYTAFRVGCTHQRAFLLGALTGFLASPLLFSPGYYDFWQSIGGFFILLAVAAACQLVSGAHFLATYFRTWKAWLITFFWAFCLAFFVAFALPYPLAVVLAPLIWLCFLPLWSANLRVLHSLAFALVYLLVIQAGKLPGSSDWPIWVSIAGMSLLPELLSWLYPERVHKLDSFPVITPTLTLRQKILSLKEVFSLTIDFYALTMEKYNWFRKITFAGKYLTIAGILLEMFFILMGNASNSFLYSFFLFIVGLILVLGEAGYETAAFVLIFYALAFGAGRGILHAGFQPDVIIWALVLFFLGVLIWFSRPKETKEDLERWKNLNSLPDTHHQIPDIAHRENELSGN